MGEDPQTRLLAPILTGCHDNLAVGGLLVHEELKTSLMNQLCLRLVSAKCQLSQLGLRWTQGGQAVSREGGSAAVPSSCRKPGQNLLQMPLCLGVIQPWVRLSSHRFASSQETLIDKIR